MPLRGPAAWSRETRLLWLTIAVSLGVLFVLAQFRFPNEGRPAPTPQPLERLAARATYDELAADVARLERRLSASLVVLRANRTRAPEAKSLRQLLDRGAGAEPATPFIPALRIRSDIALALLGPDMAVQGVVGRDDAVPLVLAADPLRRLAVVRVPEPPAGVAWQPPTLEELSAPGYVAAAEGARGGPALRPVFVGRADRFEEPRWATPMLALGSSPIVAEGAFVFSLQGELVGLVVNESGVVAVVPGSGLDAASNALLGDGSPHITDFGIALRPLGGADVKALDVTAGLFVDEVEPKSLADGKLRAGDLLLAVDDRPAVNVDGVLLYLSKIRPGTSARFRVRRKDSTIDVEISVPPMGPVVGASR